jgi:UDP-N-acetyl-D-mannosaminuronate dehydrogenase
MTMEHGSMASVPLSDETLRLADCIVVLTDHSSFDIPHIVANSRLVVDTRNVTRGLEGKFGERIWKLGAPAPSAQGYALAESA